MGKRLFIGLNLDETTCAAIDALTARLRSDSRIQNAGRATWVTRDRLHVTLHFEADAAPDAERRMLGALAHPIPCRPFGLKFGGLGLFPERGSPRVLWLGIREGRSELAAVHREIARRLGHGDAGAGGFQPHLTLARFRDRVRSGLLADIARFPAVAGPSPIDRVTLYESHLSPNGPTYVVLARAALELTP